jgi:hypothetical protein
MATEAPQPNPLSELASAVARSQQLSRELAAVQERVAALTKLVTENVKRNERKPSEISRPVKR